jgi:endonuclease YncB( thermonuclease family)
MPPPPHPRRFIGAKTLLALAGSAWLAVLALRHDEQADAGKGRDAGHAEAPSNFTARVIVVSDGDSLTLRTPERRELRVRLHGIDAPEWQQPGGTQSRTALAALVQGKTVRVSSVEMDPYDRLVVDLYDGTNWVNETLVAGRWARHYTQHSDSPALAQAERAARARKLGLWRDPHPVPPWVWRQRPENRSDRGRPPARR